jgi:hypothetical protein
MPHSARLAKDTNQSNNFPTFTRKQAGLAGVSRDFRVKWVQIEI